MAQEDLGRDPTQFRRVTGTDVSWHRAFTENLGIKAIALLLAAALYIHVVTDRQVEQVISLPVEITGLADSLALSSLPPKELGVRVRATGKQLIRLRVLQPPVQLDLSGVEAGTYQRGLTAADFKSVSDENIEVLAPVEPATITLNLEPRATERISVSVRLTGEPASGYVIGGEPIVQPSQVRLSGPESWVLDQAGIETVPFDISGARDEIGAMLSLVPPPSWARVMPGSVLVSIPIEARASGVELLEPEIVGLRGANFIAQVDPPQVRVTWLAPQSKVEEILSSLQVKVDVGRRGRGRFILPVHLTGAGTTYVQTVEPESVAVTLH